jgi:GxxExxY protein
MVYYIYMQSEDKTDIGQHYDDNKFIYDIANRVYEQLGPGHTEFIYHRAMEIELRTKRVDYETEKRVLIIYTVDSKDYTLGEERIDLYLHEYRTIIELKAMINAPKETEIAQVHKYYRELKKIGIDSKYGIIINFPQAGSKIAKNDIDFYEISFNLDQKTEL